MKTHIVIHHSLTEDSRTLSWGPVREYHKKKGWKDIGYHYGIEQVRDGIEILIGRMVDVEGAHCRENGMNHKGIGVLVMGNFDIAVPSKELWNMTKRLVLFLMRHHKIAVHRVNGHCYHNPHKSCPGKFFHMDKFRQELAEEFDIGDLVDRMNNIDPCSSQMHDINNSLMGISFIEKAFFEGAKNLAGIRERIEKSIESCKEGRG